MPTKPRQNEEEYFAQEDALKKKKLALAEAKKLLEEQRAELKRIHFMHCPKCGMTLHTIIFKGVEVDRCFNCHGTWLDDGELEKVGAHEEQQKGAWVKSVLGLFETSNKARKKK